MSVQHYNITWLKQQVDNNVPLKWREKNLLGFALMETRDFLKAENTQ